MYSITYFKLVGVLTLKIFETDGYVPRIDFSVVVPRDVNVG